MKNYKILLADNDIQALDKFKIDFNDYNIRTFARSSDVLKIIKEEKFDVFLLDIYMIGIDGINLCREIKLSSLNRNAHVIAYAYEKNEHKKLKIFQEGFDDFIEKSTCTNLLKTKINALLKQKYMLENISVNINQLVGIDHTYYLNGKIIKLTHKEFNIIELLSSKECEYYSSSTIEELIKHNETYTDISTCRVHIKNIRSKLSKLEPNKEYIKTVHNKGYVLVNLEVFSINSNKLHSLSKSINSGTKHKPIIDAIKSSNITPIKKLMEMTSSESLKGERLKNQNFELEKKVYSIYLNQNLFDKCEEITNQKGIDISSIIEDFLDTYCIVESLNKLKTKELLF